LGLGVGAAEPWQIAEPVRKVVIGRYGWDQRPWLHYVVCGMARSMGEGIGMGHRCDALLGVEADGRGLGEEGEVEIGIEGRLVGWVVDRGLA